MPTALRASDPSAQKVKCGHCVGGVNEVWKGELGGKEKRLGDMKFERGDSEVCVGGGERHERRELGRSKHYRGRRMP